MERIKRRPTREVAIGSVRIGGNRPIAVQSMTRTRTEDAGATLRQIHTLHKAGCEIVRVAVPHSRALRSLERIVGGSPLPVVADVHFRKDVALGVLKIPVAKLRINPGNLTQDAFREVLDAAGACGVPIRIGVNAGSVPADLLERYGGGTVQALLAAVERFVHTAQRRGFDDLVLSVKSSSSWVTYQAYRKVSEQFPYPLHLGLTEAGDRRYGVVKTAAALGGLLLEGIGDTLRVSLCGAPRWEVEAAFGLLKATGRRLRDPEIVACPTCGRAQIDVQELLRKVTETVRGVRIPLRIAVCGCVVNGPGEAREADLGVSGGGGQGVVFRRGQIICRVPEEGLLGVLREEIERLAKEHNQRQEHQEER